MGPDSCDQAGRGRESIGVPVRGHLHRRRHKASVHFLGRPVARVALALIFAFAGCNVYDQTLIDGAIGEAGSPTNETGGTPTRGGTGGSLGGGGSITGGVSGSAPGGGTAGSGGTQDRGGSSGDGGEGDASSGGTDAGRGGTGGTGNSSNGGDAGSGSMSGAGGSAMGGAGSGAGGSMMGGAGSGGTVSGGAGGGAGGAGAGGAGAGGAGAGGAGAGGGGAGGGGGEVCTGCARLSVPLATNMDRAHFVIGLPAATNFSVATIAIRVARYAGTGGHFKVYIQEGSPNYLQQVSTETPIASIGTTMQTINWDVATAGTAADKTIISRVGIEIIGTGATSWTNPTVVYVDSVTITGTNLTMASFTFDTASTVSTTPTSSGPSNVMWLNNYSSDTNVTGATLSWLGP